MIGKYNKRSISVLEQVSKNTHIGSGSFGSQTYSKAVKMLPHEKHLGIKMYDTKKTVRKISDVTVLLQAEKYAKIYGSEYLNSLCNPSSTSPLQQQYDKASDEVLLNTVRSKYTQRPSEIMAEEYINIANAQQLENDTKEYVQQLAQQQQQQQTEGAQ